MNSDAKTPRDKAIDAIDILNDLMNEIMTGVDVYKYYLGGYKAKIFSFDNMAGAQRLCFTSIILALNKIREFNKRYLRIVPQGHRGALKDLQETIIQKRIPEFRDHCIGHIWDGETNQPVKHSAVMDRLSLIVGTNPMAFMRWLHVTGRRDTVTGTLETIRDALMTEYSVTVDEVINR
jgi:hypothetical protein